MTARRQPAAKVRTAPRQLAANDPTDPASKVAASPIRRSSDSVAPKADSMQHKSVPLLIQSVDDDSGTCTGLASVFDNLTTTVTSSVGVR